MKMLVQRTPVTDAAPFWLPDVQAHVRVSDEAEAATLEAMAATAAAEIEQFGQIALLYQTVRVTIFDRPTESYLRLPIGPVADDARPTVTIDGNPFTDFRFTGGIRPCITWGAGFNTLRPGWMSIEYQAGFGPTSADIPRDLGQALLDQTALHYDGRSPMDAKSLTTSPHMARIGARYRGVQI